MISKSGMQAIQALVMLAQQPNGARVGVREIARKTGAPGNYLGKLLQILCRSGRLVVSRKGRGGGFGLARDPRKITLIEVLEPVDNISRWAECFLNGGRCSEGHRCAAHDRWGAIRRPFMRFLEQTTIADLASEPTPPVRRRR